ncbi:MAG: DMT family transporter [Maritimibacter sp.]|jgi:drug/metabolite transporter (DMT)-like permease
MENLRGALLMILSMAGFAGEDAFIKLVAEHMPIGEILIYLGLGGAIGFGALAMRKGYCMIGRGFFHPAMLMRAGGEIIGTSAYVWSFTAISLSLASALLQAVPLFVTLGAILFYSERVGWRRWFAIILGLTGVVIILRPGLEGFRPEAIWGVVAALALAIRDLATRSVPRNIHPLQIASWGFLAVVPAGVFLMALSDGFVRPTGADFALLGGGLVIGMIGYYALTLAMQVGEMGFVTPFRYVRLVFAFVIAWAVFDERPDAMTFLGGAIVVAAGLYTLIRERQMLRKAPF